VGGGGWEAPDQPREAVKVAKGKTKRIRETRFTLEERCAILAQASAAMRNDREPWQRCAGRCRMPWLCAYSGARIGEMVQLRKQDVLRDDGRHQDDFIVSRNR